MLDVRCWMFFCCLRGNDRLSDICVQRARKSVLEALAAGWGEPALPITVSLASLVWTRYPKKRQRGLVPWVKFRTGEMRRTAEPAIELGGEPHAENRRGKVNPTARPDAAGRRGGDSERGVDAHARERRFKGDVKENEGAGEESSVAGNTRRICD